MINLLSESSNWDKIFSFIFDVFLFIFDVIWNTKLPMTKTTITYFVIFFMVIKLTIYAIHCTSTQYNELGLIAQNSTSKLYSSTACGVLDTKQGIQKHVEERKQFKINRNKQQLSSLAKQAKTREQGYRRVNK
ncbi:hypothetical protein [Spiroplasma endosymbiont of Seladonia tumulorum]|uniref:hypothetical protein n=1 Tax=Spiroplasma endosymbiont of Seladonia tumulorum TaxID=3066321 RepID=UPI0030CB027C